jgi:hypothetical protein
VKQKDSGDKLIFGIFSGREVFYLLLALFVIIVLLLYGWEFNGTGRETSPANSKNKIGRETARHIHERGGVPLSETQILYYDDGFRGREAWRIYDTSTGSNTDGSFFARALYQTGKFQVNPATGGWLSGWRGSIIFSTFDTNANQLIFQWKTNEDKLQTFNTADFTGGQKILSHLLPGLLVPVENGWLYSFAPNKWQGPLQVTGNQFGPMILANPFPTNEEFGSSWPFQGRLYVTAIDTNKNTMSVFVLSLTNRAVLYSNLSVKIPVSFDEFIAQPDPSGGRVIWLFYREPKIVPKLLSVLPRGLRDRFTPGPTFYYYSSDLHTTSFRFVCSLKMAGAYPFLWGVNGDSIWLPDPERGIKRYDLK